MSCGLDLLSKGTDTKGQLMLIATARKLGPDIIIGAAIKISLLKYYNSSLADILSVKLILCFVSPYLLTESLAVLTNAFLLR